MADFYCIEGEAVVSTGVVQAKQRRDVYRYDPYNSFEGDIVEFRLTYDGQLFASSNKNPHAKHKHDIRRVFHPQLKRLWEMNPHLLEFRESMPLNMVGIAYEGDPEPTRVDLLANKFGCEEYRLVPLVTEELGLICAIDILLLRPDMPGSLITSGDIDGRLKTIFDALRRPLNNSELGGCSPGTGENPLYCLLEDDKLITHISVGTDILLQPVSFKNVADEVGVLPQGHRMREIGQNDVRLLITIKLRPTKLGWGNLDFI